MQRRVWHLYAGTINFRCITVRTADTRNTSVSRKVFWPLAILNAFLLIPWHNLNVAAEGSQAITCTSRAVYCWKHAIYHITVMFMSGMASLITSPSIIFQWRPMDSPHKGPVIQEAFPCYELVKRLCFAGRPMCHIEVIAVIAPFQYPAMLDYAPTLASTHQTLDKISAICISLNHLLCTTIQFTNNQHWSEWWLGAKHVTDRYLSQWWPGSRTYICVTKHRWVKPTQESLCITVPLGDGMQNYQIRILSVSANSWEIPFTLLIILKHFKAFLCLREKATFPHWDFGPEHSLNAEMNFVAP